MRYLIALISWLLLCAPAYGTVLFSDNFDSQPDWNGLTDAVYLLNGETGGDWAAVYCHPQAADSYGAVDSAHGYSGKGFRFLMTIDGCGAPETAQEADLFGEAALSQPSLFWGFRLKISSTNWGDAGQTLKLTRFYPSPGSEGPSIIPGFYPGTGNLRVAYDGLYRPTTGQMAAITDTDWHSYIWQFERGENSNDGVIRLWLDGELEYEDTAVNWNGTGTNFTYSNFPMMQGNLSGDYNGDSPLYTYWDDYIWATTLTEVQSFLGEEPEPPATPTASTQGAGISGLGVR